MSAPEATEAGAAEAPIRGARLGVALLCHADLRIAAHMARLWSMGGAAVAIHIDSKAPDSEAEQMMQALSDLPDIVFVERRSCEWGMFSLVDASLATSQALLAEFPEVSHVILASGSCLPLRPPEELLAYLHSHADTDFIESVSTRDVGWTVGGLNEERFSLYFPVSWRNRRKSFDRLTALQRRLGVRRRIPEGVVPHMGSQWWCLTRTTLDLILNDPRRAEFDRFFRLTWIPDESYFQSLVRRHARNLESRSLTLSKFDDQGKPYIFYDDHADMLARSRSFVARKIWPGAHELFRRFPAARPDGVVTDEPNPVRIDRMIAHAVRRRHIGRPGLYMQSRFPAKDRENGKTAAPYLVLQGFSDIFPDFRHWLGQRIDADVHGHLFDVREVEFAGDEPIGPGGWSRHPAARNYDPHGFLTSLIRITDRIQAFQYGPRDSQALNWFMATDPNAHIHVVTGAWLLPLLHSDMPFDDVRRTAARLQRIELEQLEVFRSVWVKAKIEIWELSDFLARRSGIMQRIVMDHSGFGMPHFDELPEMRDTSGLAAFLQRLRNAGLQPRLMGEFPLDGSEAPPLEEEDEELIA